MVKKWLYAFMGLALVGLLCIYVVFFKNNVRANSNVALKLREAHTYESILDSVEHYGVLESNWTFKVCASVLGLKNIPNGKYAFTEGTNNFTLIRRLKNGYQSPVSCVISTANTLDELASKLQKYVIWDSAQILQCIYDDSNQAKYHYNKENALCFFIPNTYELYWNSSLDRMMSKMAKQHDVFWDKERRMMADRLALTPNEVYILASMVQKEYSQKSERAKIAGVIYNRLKINMPLQIDATCKYATRDFAAKRITSVHLNFDSPYNTYKNRGLPPGPICIPELSTIDAVLHLEDHSYLFYCADPSMNGFHIFSETMSNHSRVANDYHQKLDQIGIK